MSHSCFSSLRLLNGIRLGGLSVRHLGVLLLWLGGVALLGLGLALLALDLGLLGGGLLLPLLALFRLLLLELVVVSLDDGAGDGADVLLLGDVLCLGSVLAVLVQPVLGDVSVAFAQTASAFLTSICSSLALSLDFSSSLANSAYWSMILSLSS